MSRPKKSSQTSTHPNDLHAHLGKIFEPISVKGYIDNFGYSSAAGGWLFNGWIPRPFRTEQNEFVECQVQFEQSELKGRTTLAFYQREDLKHTGIGVIAFVPGSSRAIGNLQFVSFTSASVIYQAQAGLDSRRVQDREIVEQVRQILISRALANSNREKLLSITSRPGFAGQETLSLLTEPVFLEIDEAILCPPGGVLIKGWMLSAAGAIQSIRVRSGPSVGELDLSRSISVARPDVIQAVGQKLGFSDARCGFVGFVPAAVTNGDVCYLEVELTSGEVGFKNLKISRRSGIDAIRGILEGIDARYGEIDHAFDEVLGPAISALNTARLEKPSIAFEMQLGAIKDDPSYSLIIPLYGRVDFIEYQMALFSLHDDIKSAEIIYVLDDPRRRRELEHLAHATYERFGLSFRLLLLPNNLGFAPASNVGLRRAAGEFICFMNSDVFPITPNWMKVLIDELRRDKSLGVIGPRLLYEDGSIQHEGSYYCQIAEFGSWTFVDHYNKGCRPSEERGIRRCDVITGACMVMRRELALELGGFDEAFIVGDFEDSDLCLKVRERGLGCAIADRAQLYHLERKSQTAPDENWRMNLTLYNAWLHQRRWFPTRASTLNTGKVKG